MALCCVVAPGELGDGLLTGDVQPATDSDANAMAIIATINFLIIYFAYPACSKRRLITTID